MTNEAVLLFETEFPIPHTVADGTGIEKGALLALSDPMTAATATARYCQVAGIAATEKIANDGTTKLGVFKKGIFKFYLSGAAVIGNPLVCAVSGSGIFPNFVETASGSTIYNSGSIILGYALETGANGETIKVRLDL
jgi:hypothetical protein